MFLCSFCMKRLFYVLVVAYFSSAVLHLLSFLGVQAMMNSLFMLMGVENSLLSLGLVPYYQDNVLIWLTADV